MAGGKPKAGKHEKDRPRRSVADLPDLPIVPDGAPPTPLTYACLGDTRRVQLIVEEFPEPLLAAIAQVVGAGTQLRIDYGELKPREETRTFGNNPSRARTSSEVVAVDLTRIPDDEVLRAIVWRETLRWAQLRVGPLHFRAWRSFLGNEAELRKVGDVVVTLMDALLDGDRIQLPGDSIQPLMQALQLAFLDTDRERYLFDQKLIRPDEQWPILQDLVEHLASMRTGQRQGEFLDQGWARLRKESPNEPQVTLTQFAPLVLNHWIHVVQLRWARLAPLLWAREKTGIVERFLTIEREVQQRSLGRYWDDELLERTFRGLAAAGGNSGLAWKAWHELARGTAKWVKRELGPEVEARRSRPRTSGMQLTLEPSASNTQPATEYGLLLTCEPDQLPRLDRVLADLRPGFQAATFNGQQLSSGCLSEGFRERRFDGSSRVILYPDQVVAALDLREVGDAELHGEVAHAVLKLLQLNRLDAPFFYERWTLPAIQEAVDEVGANLLEGIADEVGLPPDRPLVSTDDAQATEQVSWLPRLLVAALREADVRQSMLGYKIVTAEQASAWLAAFAARVERIPPNDGLATEIATKIKGAATRVEGIYAGSIAALEPLCRLALRNFSDLGGLIRIKQGEVAIDRYVDAALAQMRPAFGPYLDEAAFEACWRAMIVANSDLEEITQALAELALATCRAVDRATPREDLEPEPSRGGLKVFRVGEPARGPELDSEGRPIHLQFCALGDHKRLEAAMAGLPQGLKQLAAGGVIWAFGTEEKPGIRDIFRKVGGRVFMVESQRAVYVDLQAVPGDGALRSLLWRQAGCLFQTLRGRPFELSWSWIASQEACTSFALPALEQLASMFGFAGQGADFEDLPEISRRLQGSLWRVDLERFLYAQKILEPAEQAEALEDWHRENLGEDDQVARTLEALATGWGELHNESHPEATKAQLSSSLFMIWFGICRVIWERLLPLRWTGQAEQLVEDALRVERAHRSRVWTRFVDGPAIDAALRALDEARDEPEKIQAAFVALAARAGEWVAANW